MWMALRPMSVYIDGDIKSIVHNIVLLYIKMNMKGILHKETTFLSGYCTTTCNIQLFFFFFNFISN